MAFPIAKTVAVKDACDHFGKLFGSDLNRKDEIVYSVDLTIQPLDENHPNWVKACEAVKVGKVTIERLKKSYDVPEESETYLKSLIS
jgi:type II restriction/modification system DNA methylase subunit YeeA